VWEGRFVPNTALLAAAKDNAAGSQLDGVVPLCIRKVVSETSLEDRLDLLISVAFDYRELANALMHLLAQQLNVDVSRFAAKGSWHDLDQSGQLRKQEGSAAPDGEWSYFFHGQDCAFRSLSTGRTVEARLGFGPICGDDFGVFDPGFFLGFINSSLASRYEYQPIADLLCDWWENARLALELMEDRGVLRRVSRRVEDQLSWVMNRDAADSRRL